MTQSTPAGDGGILVTAKSENSIRNFYILNHRQFSRLVFLPLRVKRYVSRGRTGTRESSKVPDGEGNAELYSRTVAQTSSPVRHEQPDAGRWNCFARARAMELPRLVIVQVVALYYAEVAGKHSRANVTR